MPGTTGGPGGPGGSGASDRPAAARDTEAHCRAYDSVGKKGKALDSTAWQRLVLAAGGAENVEAYCAALSNGSGKPNKPNESNKPDKSGKSNGSGGSNGSKEKKGTVDIEPSAAAEGSGSTGGKGATKKAKNEKNTGAR
ncbi:hypothetical protein FGF04_15350 [Streptomyces apricus]|uniref:Uncharacterized protein n=1 Tax=Streptomyces apricus TaxID=1828112 RepID=A0A5B0AZJ7_9ACTN|nr:hypothetical protein FGF04_15350 [Streptomyces apricus]